jgi:RNA-directed DNA polymerase
VTSSIRERAQEVTGVVVNDKPGVARDDVRRLRAILHLAEKTGLAAQNREDRPHFEAWRHGKIGYVMIMDRAKGTALAEKLARVLSRSASP